MKGSEFEHDMSGVTAVFPAMCFVSFCVGGKVCVNDCVLRTRETPVCLVWAEFKHDSCVSALYDVSFCVQDRKFMLYVCNSLRRKAGWRRV